MEIGEIEAIIRILSKSDVAEFELDRNGVKLKITRAKSITNQKTSFQTAVVNPSEGAEISVKQEIADASASETYVKVQSPIVGTFYRRSNPEAEPFVTEGQTVQKGDTLCIIEAMKIMNEIEAPTSGKVVKVLLEDSEVVEYGETLFLIDPNV